MKKQASGIPVSKSWFQKVLDATSQEDLEEIFNEAAPPYGGYEPKREYCSYASYDRGAISVKISSNVTYDPKYDHDTGAFVFKGEVSIPFGVELEGVYEYSYSFEPEEYTTFKAIYKKEGNWDLVRYSWNPRTNMAHDLLEEYAEKIEQIAIRKAEIKKSGLKLSKPQKPKGDEKKLFTLLDHDNAQYRDQAYVLAHSLPNGSGVVAYYIDELEKEAKKLKKQFS